MADVKKPRSEYSKNGCKECKRRKIKCDEFRNPPPEAVRKINKQGRESCWHCTRLRKECVYPVKGEKVARVSRKALMAERQNGTSGAVATVAETSGGSGTHGVSGAHGASGVHGGSGVMVEAGLNGANGLVMPGYGNGIPNPNIANGVNGSNGVNGIHNGYMSVTPGFPMPASRNVSLSMYFPQMNQQNYGMRNFQPLIHDQEAHPYDAFSQPLRPSLPWGAGRHNGHAPGGSVESVSTSGMGSVHGGGGAGSSGSMLPIGPANKSGGAVGQSGGSGASGANVNGGASGASGTSGASGANGDTSGLMMGLHTYDAADLTVLASDLNNLVSDLMYDIDYDVKIPSELENNGTPPTPSSEGAAAGTAAYDWIPRNIGLEYVGVKHKEEQLFLQEFYHEFANIILPFNPYDHQNDMLFNPARDILLKCAAKEPFLLAAVLAQGARSLAAKHNRGDDDEAYYKYLLRCLKLLGPALGDALGKNSMALVSNVEAVLLTVLLLTSCNAVTPKQNWRPHLKGAKDLLLKHSRTRAACRNSKVLIFCKSWFLLFEVLAGLGSTLGGTIKSDHELDLLLNWSDPFEVKVLEELGLILPNGFNLIGGYHNDCVPLFRDLIKLLNRRREALQNHRPFVADDVSEYIRLMAEFDRHRATEFYSTKCLLIADEFPCEVAPAGFLLDTVYVKKVRKVLSWSDAAQQMYCIAAIITILTEMLGLPPASPAVQALVSQMAPLFEFTCNAYCELLGPQGPLAALDLLALLALLACPARPTLTPGHCPAQTSLHSPPAGHDSPRDFSPNQLLFKYGILMVQWPALVAGVNAVRDQDRACVERFFLAASSVGAGSAGHSLNRVRRAWSRRLDAHDDHDEPHVDVVMY